MVTITLEGNKIHTVGELPEIGERAPDFLLTKVDLTDVTLKDFNGKEKILNIVPSLDTEVCAMSAKRFNEEASRLENCVILTVSNDLPFAQKRFCESTKIDRIITLSQLRNRDFGKDYGVEIADGPLAGLLARTVLLLDKDNRVVYKQLVKEITNEPDYDAAIKAVSKI